jgi:hypothetical protein
MSLFSDGMTPMHYYRDADGVAHLEPVEMKWADANEGFADALDSARVAGTTGDVLGGIDEASAEVGRARGRVETLLWAQNELQGQLESWAAVDRFADLRALQAFLVLVQDNLRIAQDGTEGWPGFARTVVEAAEVASDLPEAVPGTEMGG